MRKNSIEVKRIRATTRGSICQYNKKEFVVDIRQSQGRTELQLEVYFYVLTCVIHVCELTQEA